MDKEKRRHTALANTSEIAAPNDKGKIQSNNCTPAHEDQNQGCAIAVKNQEKGNTTSTRNKDQTGISARMRENHKRIMEHDKKHQEISAACEKNEHGKFTVCLRKCKYHLDNSSESTSIHEIDQHLNVSANGNKESKSTTANLEIDGRGSLTQINYDERGASAQLKIDEEGSIAHLNKDERNETAQWSIDQSGATAFENNEVGASSDKIIDEGKAILNVNMAERGATENVKFNQNNIMSCVNDHQSGARARYQKQDWSKSANEILCIDGTFLQIKIFFSSSPSPSPTPFSSSPNTFLSYLLIQFFIFVNGTERSL